MSHWFRLLTALLTLVGGQAATTRAAFGHGCARGLRAGPLPEPAVARAGAPTTLGAVWDIAAHDGTAVPPAPAVAQPTCQSGAVLPAGAMGPRVAHCLPTTVTLFEEPRAGPSFIGPPPFRPPKRV